MRAFLMHITVGSSITRSFFGVILASFRGHVGLIGLTTTCLDIADNFAFWSGPGLLVSCILAHESVRRVFFDVF